MTDPAAARPKLLVVEDDQGLCNQYRWAFAEFDVTFAHTRAEAETAVQRLRPPIAVVDLGLPPDPDGVSEGLATIADILRIEPHTKVVVATSHGDRRYALQAISAGAYDFCEKLERGRSCCAAWCSGRCCCRGWRMRTAGWRRSPPARSAAS